MRREPGGRSAREDGARFNPNFATTGAIRHHRRRSALQFRNDVLAGMRARPRHLPSVYFYDDRGSELFEQITRLPEYYLTRVEHAILREHADGILAPLRDSPACIVDLGAGDGSKTRILLERAHALGIDMRYAPVDVSAAALISAERTMREALPWLRVDPVHDEYAAGLARVRFAQAGRRLLVLWLGSSIGNFMYAEAARTLARLAEATGPEDLLLVGFDLLKDPRRLLAAYDDTAGVTAEFNYNLLARINRELEGDFDPSAFAHHATFAPDKSAVESYLVSRIAQTVTVAGERFEFDAWEPIHTEVSCKYSQRQIDGLLSEAGLARVATFGDERGWFADVCCSRRREDAEWDE